MEEFRKERLRCLAQNEELGVGVEFLDAFGEIVLAVQAGNEDTAYGYLKSGKNWKRTDIANGSLLRGRDKRSGDPR